MTNSIPPTEDPACSVVSTSRPKFSLRALAPLIAIAAISVVLIGTGWHRQLSFETIARHHDLLRNFIASHEAMAVSGYVACYAAAIALSLPVGVYLSVLGGMLFGTVLGGTAAVLGASIGAICIFVIARNAMTSALGEHFVRRAGPLAEKIAHGFRADAFSYLLFLRLVPAFPFWLINLVPALCGVRLAPFAAATALGILPATFAFAFVGSGLESVISAQQAAYQSCLAAGHADCRLMFRADAAFTPQLLAALAALGALALVPVAVKRWRSRVTHSTR